MNPYEVLGLHRAATDSEVKVAHRRLAKINHPDAGGDAEDFANIQRAYEILIDPERRRKFDETGQTDDAPDNTEGLALQHVIAAFGEMVGLGVDLAQADVPAEMARILQRKVADVDRQLRQVQKDLGAARDALKRLKRPEAGPDPLTAFISGQIVAVERAVEDAAHVKAVLERAKTIAQAYGWERDAAAAPFAAGAMPQMFTVRVTGNYSGDQGTTL